MILRVCLIGRPRAINVKSKMKKDFHDTCARTEQEGVELDASILQSTLFIMNTLFISSKKYSLPGKGNVFLTVQY